MTDLERDLINDWTRNGKWGTLVFEYCAGELTFVVAKETFKVTPSENNSGVPMRRHNGTYDEKLAKNQ